MWRKSPAGNFAISSTTCATVSRDGVTNSRKFCTEGRRSLSGALLAHRFSAPQSTRQLWLKIRSKTRACQTLCICLPRGRRPGRLRLSSESSECYPERGALSNWTNRDDFITRLRAIRWISIDPVQNSWHQNFVPFHSIFYFKLFFLSSFRKIFFNLKFVAVQNNFDKYFSVEFNSLFLFWLRFILYTWR